MKKLRCPHCGVINLEKFVTYPHCVGCGALLPESTNEQLPAWRRPLRAGLWATLLGLAVVVLIAAAALWQNTPAEIGQMLVYGRAPRKTVVGHIVIVVVTVDAVVPASSLRPPGDLTEVSLRLPRNLLRDFQLVSIDPEPVSHKDLGGGRYFLFASIPHESNIHLTLRARRAGIHQLQISLQTPQHASAEFHSTITVAPAKKPATPRPAVKPAVKPA